MIVSTFLKASKKLAERFTVFPRIEAVILALNLVRLFSYVVNSREPTLQTVVHCLQHPVEDLRNCILTWSYS